MANEIVPQSFLKGLSIRVEQVLPKFIDKSRFLQIILEEFRKTPRLAQCDSGSLTAAVIKCSREGLEPGEECYLVPRWNGRTKRYECAYQRGYPGVLALARRSGEFSSINVGIVRENDQFELVEGTENKLIIHRAMKNRGDVLFYWAASTMISGEKSFEILPLEEAEEHRDKFATKDKNGKISDPWLVHFDSMAKKTVLLMHLKYKPRSYVAPLSDEGVFRIVGDDRSVDAVQVTDNQDDITAPVTVASLIENHRLDTADDIIPGIFTDIDKCATVEEVEKWRNDNLEKVMELPGDQQNKIFDHVSDVIDMLGRG